MEEGHKNKYADHSYYLKIIYSKNFPEGQIK